MHEATKMRIQNLVSNLQEKRSLEILRNRWEDNINSLHLVSLCNICMCKLLYISVHF
jgi:hypothetical protein